MKQRGRDVLIGILVGAALIIWVTTRHHSPPNSASSHPSTSASATVSPRAGHQHATHAAKAPAKTPAKTHAHASTAPSAHPTPLTQASTRMASSSKPADSGIGNGVIAIAALIAIAASLSTVTLTVHHFRAGSMRGETR